MPCSNSRPLSGHPQLTRCWRNAGEAIERMHLHIHSPFQTLHELIHLFRQTSLCQMCISLKLSSHRDARVPSPDLIRLYFHSLSSQRPRATDIYAITSPISPKTAILSAEDKKYARSQRSRRFRCGWTGLTCNAALRKHACRESSAVCVCCLTRADTDRA